MSEKPALSHRFESFLETTDRDLLAELLADKRSLNTRRAYKSDLKQFFEMVIGQSPTRDLVDQFLMLERYTAIALVLKYKSKLISQGLAEATVNRRLAAVKSLVRYAQKVGKCLWSLEEIQGEKVQAYRDTSGVDAPTYQRILATCDRQTPIGKRNYALLRLLWDNVLRRSEVTQTNLGDLSQTDRTLRILGKGKGTQSELITLTESTVGAIAQWLEARGNGKPSDPLFIALDSVYNGHRLSGQSLYEIVRDAAKSAGVEKVFSPHRVRHSGITAALNALDGDVRSVQKLSRHRKLDTLMIYDDNRANLQGAVSDRLSELLDE